MLSNNLLLIFLALVISLGFSAFQYFYKSKISRKFAALFTFLRFLSYFCLLLLLINPEIESTKYYTEKPTLVLAVDNSGSIENLNAAEEVRRFAQELRHNPEIQERFAVKNYIFGEDLQEKDSLDFSGNQTNIHQTLSSLNRLYKDQKAPTVLITDGNQTFGEDYNFTAAGFKNTIYPVVVGDTTALQDISVSRVNVNKYAYIDNRFPVEIFLNYDGEEPVDSRLEIRSGNSIIFSEDLEFDQNTDSKIVNTTLPASGKGVKTYTVEILPLEDEQDTLNNRKDFAVEVLGERTSILLAASIVHPDLGAIKKSIESNQQRQVEIHKMDQPLPDLDEYQLIILYQPKSGFEPLLEQIEEEKRNYWMITGPETDFRFLNRSQKFFQKEITGQTEEFFGVLNTNFSAYQVEDIGFSQFPPLEGAFGEHFFTVPAVPVLYQKIQGIETESPLLAIAEQEEMKTAVLFGANLWKWRTAYYLENNSFQGFDEFIGKLVQFLATRQKKDRLTVTHEPFYYGNERVTISAEYFDRNYRFDPRGKLSLELVDVETQETRSIPFLLKEKSYEVVLSELPPSQYNLRVDVAGESFSEGGEFQVTEYNVEQQFGRANLAGLQRISEEHEQPLYYIEDSSELVNALLSDNNYIPVQKSREKAVSLIEWYYLLGIIVFALSLEWFLRKYYGYI